MKQREAEGIFRPDLIHLLMEARKGKLKHEETRSKNHIDEGFASVEECRSDDETSTKTLTDSDMVAQALIFFLAGFDTSSTLACFMAHELAVNPDIQSKLQDEIDAIQGDELTYEGLLAMKYMDQVVSGR